MWSGLAGKPLPDDRGSDPSHDRSDPSHDRKGVVAYRRTFGLFLFAIAAWAQSVPPSPGIESLKAALQRQQSGAVGAFWAEISAGGGTPLIECPAALAPDCLTTFLWRGDAASGNVVVRSEAMPGAPGEHVLSHLPGTDIWYRTYRFGGDARFMYLLSIHDPLTPWDVSGPGRAKRYAGLRTDPLNRHVTPDPRSTSYVSLPRAPSERWIEDRSGVAHGSIRTHKLRSETLAGERSLDAYTTPGFAAGVGVTPVLIFFDGEESKAAFRAPAILDNLYAEGLIPPVIAVFLSQPYETRETDLGCSKATGLFVAGELLPWLRQEYKVHTAAERTILAGASFGGLAAACAALQHPEAIGRVLSQSGSFWWGRTEAEHEWLTAEFQSRPKVNVKFYLDVGLMETVGGAISQLATNRRLRDVLRGKGYQVIYREFNGTHAYPCWRAEFADALRGLLAD
jgi:enterochelin esterase family protein